MAQRGLEDWEIALIKRMMEEKYARDKMHAYFNKPERTLTPAAYSEIKLGRFGTDVAAASAEMLARFIEEFSKSPDAAASDPVGALTMSRLLSLHADGSKLKEVENDQIEFKVGFSFGDNTFSKIVRAIAALANNSGGYIFCGIEDNTGIIRGISSASQFDCDLSRWSQSLKSCLMPLPVFERITVDIGEFKVGVIYVEPAGNKPVVATKRLGEKIRAGAIYYRYPGQSSEIGYGELTEILAERDRKSQRNLLDSLNIFAERSPSELAVIDLKNGELVNADQTISLSKEFVDQLSVIREGEFVERHGAPAVRILANATLQSMETGPPQIVRGFVSDGSLVRNFVCREAVQEPLQYFLAAVNSSSDWLPIFRWISEAKLTTTQAASLVEAENLSPKKRLRALDRLSGKRSVHAHIPSMKQTVARLQNLDLPSISTATELRRVMQAVRMIKDVDEAQLNTLWSALRAGYEFAWAPANGGDLQSYVKAAAARVDELEEATRR
jgi:hypothetical protein